MDDILWETGLTDRCLVWLHSTASFQSGLASRLATKLQVFAVTYKFRCNVVLPVGQSLVDLAAMAVGTHAIIVAKIATVGQLDGFDTGFISLWSIPGVFFFRSGVVPNESSLTQSTPRTSHVPDTQYL